MKLLIASSSALALLVITPLALLIASTRVSADPYAPVTVDPVAEDAPPIFSPGIRLVADLEQDYVEEEFFVSGAATVYTYSDPDDPKPDGIEPLGEDVPYTTRIIVRRPADPHEFSGTVIIEWWNSTAGFDTAPVWDPSAEFFAREGWIYVGVTNSNTSIGHLLAGCSIFPPIIPETCGDRYEGLSIPENGAAYEMVSQIANLLKSSSSENPIPSDYSVERIFHAGQSQQGGSMITYASSFHFPINDGYFVQAASSARSINSVFPACGSEGADPYPGCTPRLQGDDRRVRTDLPVPVYRALTETDVSGAIRSDARQEDTHNFRYYEVAGVTHMTVHVGVELIPAGILGPDPLLLEDACMNPFNTLADGPVFGSHIYNAMWQNMVWQSRWGVRPPHGELIETTVDENGDPIIARDAFENAIGGIRPAGIAVPVATYLPNNELADSIPDPLRPLLGLACRLGGSVFPFDEETIDELYPTHRRYVKKVTAQTVMLQFHRFMLWEDAHAVREEADASGIGGDDPACGRGHEVALILPPLVFLGRRRRRARAGDAVPS